jgi:hypothetical protein
MRNPNAIESVSITLTRKEAECLQRIANYGVNDEQGDWREWDKEEKEAIKYGNQALDKISAALPCKSKGHRSTWLRSL